MFFKMFFCQPFNTLDLKEVKETKYIIAWK